MESARQVSDRVKALLEAPEQHLEELAEALSEGRRSDRPWMLEPVRVADPEHLDELRARVGARVAGLLSHADATIRIGACRVLQVASTEGAVEPALRALDDPNPGVRAVAADALAEAGSARAVEALGRCLTDPVEEVRFRAASALGLIGDEAAIPLLAERLDVETEPLLRATLLQSLGETRGEEALPHLLDALRDPVLSDPELVGVAYGLKQLGAAAVEALGRLVEELEGEALYATVQALASFDTPAAVRLLLALLSHPDPVARVHAANGLARQGHTNALTELVTLSRSEEPLARVMAAGRLADLGVASAVPVLLDHYFDPHVAAPARLALSRLPEALSTALLAALADTSAASRSRAAADLVGWLGLTDAMPRLEALVREAPAATRLAALTALVRLGQEGALAGFDELWSNATSASERRRLALLLNEQLQPLPLPLLDRLLAQPELPILATAVEWLARLDLPEALERLTSVLQRATTGELAGVSAADFDFEASLGAAHVFPELAHLVFPFMDAAVIARQRATFASPPDYLRLTVARVLLFVKPSAEEVDQDGQRALRATLESELPIVRMAVLAALVNLGGVAELESAAVLRDDPDELVRFVFGSFAYAHGDAAAAAAALVADAAPLVRLGAAVLFEERGDSAARKHLMALAADSDARVAATAKDALANTASG